MAKKVFNKQGGLHSDAAFTAFENRAWGSCVANAASFVVTPGAGMNLSISTGDGLISVDAFNARRIQVTTTETVAVPAASASFGRIDTVVAYIDTAVVASTAQVDNTNDMLKFMVVAGTAAATPVAPTGAAIQAAIGAGNPYNPLYDVLVPQSAVNTTGVTLTDRRKIINVIDTAALKDLAVTTAKIIDLAITNAKIAAGLAASKLYNPYKFSVYRIGSYSIAATTQRVAFDAANFDTSANFNTATNRFTVPATGYYYLSTKVSIGSAGMGTTEWCGVAIYKNGLQLRVSDRVNGSGDANRLAAPSITCFAPLTAGDYVEVYSLTGGVYRDVAGGSHVTFFDGFLVSTT